MAKRTQNGRTCAKRALALKLSKLAISSIVAAGGGIYVGFWRGIRNHAEPVVFFISPRTRSTLALPISCLTAEAVRHSIAESDAAFASEDGK
jgi:hypothetical protein